MDDNIKIILEDYSDKFRDYGKYIKSNDWSKKGEYDGWDLENTIVSDILANLSQFKNEINTNVYPKKIQEFFNKSIDIVNTHVNRTSNYLEEFKWSTKYESDIRNINSKIEVIESDGYISKKDEKLLKELKVSLELLKTQVKKDMVTQSEIFTKNNKIKLNLSKLNIEDGSSEKVIKSLQLFHSDKKATLYMRDFLCKHIPAMKERVNNLGINFNASVINPSTSNELLINMNPKDIPPYDKTKHFFEQPKSTIEFWEEERRKNVNGITVGGYFIHPWLYFHLNSFKIPNAEDSSSEPVYPDFRDNEYFFTEMLKLAEEDGRKALLLYGSRRISKSVCATSYLMFKLYTILNASCKAVGFTREPDLESIVTYMNVANTNMHPALNINANNMDFDSGVKLGVKRTAQERLDYAELSFVNLEGGTKKSATQKTAGGTPNGFLFDEIGKGSCIKPWLSAIPSFVKKDGRWRTIPLLAGCVCAGTKVYNHKGELINIEDLKKEEGILGFDKNNQQLSKEPITWMQPPSEKPCYRITTRKGHQLECSYEHPILVRHRNKRELKDGKRVRKIEFIPTENLKVGQQLVINESVNIWGDIKMWEPRLVGWFIGDGYYGTDVPSITSCDFEINDYIDSKFETSIKKKNEITKDGKILKQRRLKGTSKFLRELGIYGQSKGRKTLPKDVYKYDKESICELIGGLLDSDGHASFSDKHASSVCLSFGHENLVKEIMFLLNKIGVHPTYNKKIGKPTKLVPRECEYYVISISDKRSLNTLYKNVKFSIKYKQDSFEKIIKKLDSKKEQIPLELKNCRLDTIYKIEYIGIKPIYNLTAGSTNTYLANNIVTHNTAGEQAVSKDAEKILKNPEQYSVMPMNWDLLEKGVDPEWITWNKNEKFAMFVPAQLSLEAGAKIKKTFADFLDLPESSPLNNITIYVTDWEKATTLFKERREMLKTDLDLQSAEANSFPITPEDCYLTPEKNKFPGHKARLRKKLIQQNGEDGVRVKLSKNYSTNLIEVHLTDEPTITEYPYKGGNFDAPIVLLEVLDEGYEPNLGLYCMGFDDVKHDKSDGDSVISATIIKRSYEGGEWSNRIVAWYDSRPEKKDYYRNLFLLMKYYNCRVLAENEDNGYLEYLEDLDMRNGTNHVNTHMSEGVGLASEDNLNRNHNRKFGWSPTGNNIYHLEQKIVMYTKQDGVVIGGIEDLEGIDLINHPMLLEELYMYKKDQNADRIRSFGLALTLAQYYDKTYQYLQKKRLFRDEDRKDKPKKIRITKNGFTDNSRLRQF